MKNGFNWDIEQTPIYNHLGEKISGYKEITRNDSNRSIAVMKETYTPMTTEQFSDTANDVANKIGAEGLEFTDWDSDDTMGRSRPIITAQMKISDPLEIAGSKVEGSLIMGVGFDGSRSFFIGHRNTYVRCTNAFWSIMKDFTSRLTKNNMVRVEDIVKQIGLYKEHEEEIYENFKRFQEVKVDEKIIEECIARVANLSKEEREVPFKERHLHDVFSSQKLNKIDDILAGVRTEMAELGDNAWGLFNGITYYTTHVMSNRGHEGLSSMFGGKNTANQAAYNFAKELIDA